MKKFLYLVVIGLTALFAFNSCNNGEDEDPTLTVGTPAEIEMGGGSATFNITSNTDWTITKAEADSWITVDPMTGSGNTTVNLTAVANTGAERKADLTVKTGSGTLTKTVTVIQAGAEEAYLNAGTAPAISGNGGTTKFTIAANVSWNITKTEAWITNINPESGDGTTEITVTAAANDSENQRTGTLTVAGGGMEKTVTITQNAVGQGIAIDDLVGTYSVFEGLVEGEDEYYPLESDRVVITKTGANELLISGIFKTYFEDFAGINITATFDAEEERILIPAQEVEQLMKPEYKTWLSGPIEQDGDKNVSVTGIVNSGNGISISVRSSPDVDDSIDNAGFYVGAVRLSDDQYVGWVWVTFASEWTKTGASAPALAPIKDVRHVVGYTYKAASQIRAMSSIVK